MFQLFVIGAIAFIALYVIVFVLHFQYERSQGARRQEARQKGGQRV